MTTDVALIIINTATADMRTVAAEIPDTSVGDLLTEASRTTVTGRGPLRTVLVVPRANARPYIISRWTDQQATDALEAMITGIAANVR